MIIAQLGEAVTQIKMFVALLTRRILMGHNVLNVCAIMGKQQARVNVLQQNRSVIRRLGHVAVQKGAR